MSTVIGQIVPALNAEQLLESSDTTHLFCPCDENLALCGLDLSDHETLPVEEWTDDVCIVCNDIITKLNACPRCGSE